MFNQIDKQNAPWNRIIKKELVLPENMFLQHGIIHVSMASCMAFVTIIVNLYLITHIARTKSTRICKNTCYGYYLLHLCVVEIIMAALSVPFSLVCNSEDLIEQRASMYRIVFIMKRLLCCVCHTTIASMVLQRFLCLKNSMRKRKSITHLKMSLFVAWLWSITIMLPQMVPDSSSNVVDIHRKESSVYLVVLVVFVLLIPFLVILYSRVGISSLKSRDSVLLIKRCRHFKKFACTCLWLSSVLILSNLPEYIFEILVQLQHENKIQMSVNKDILSILVTLSWIYLPIIPVVYCLSYLMKLKRTRGGEQNPTNDKPKHTNSRFLTIRQESAKLSHSPALVRIQLPFHDFTSRRRSLFDLPKRSNSLDGVLDLCSRRFSEPQVDVNVELINSCLTTLESIYEKHSKKKSLFKSTFRRFSGMNNNNDEVTYSSAQELSPYPHHVVHKLNQPSSSGLVPQKPLEF